MHDVITKTLPADVDAALTQLCDRWGSEAMLSASDMLDLTPGHWSADDCRAMDALLLSRAGQRADSRMIQADEPRAEAAPASEDPLVFAVSDAITALREHMFECAIDEVQNTGRRDPDYSRADAAEAHLLKAIDALIASRIGAAAPAVCDQMQVDNGLLTSHNPDRRLL